MPQLSSADEVDPEVPLHQHSTIRDPAWGRTTSRGDRGAHERTAPDRDLPPASSPLRN